MMMVTQNQVPHAYASDDDKDDGNVVTKMKQFGISDLKVWGVIQAT